MAVNKVEVGGETVIDLTADTVSENNLLVGATAHNAAGEPIEGAVVVAPIDSELSETSGNPVQNKAVFAALSEKASSSHSHTVADISDFPEISGGGDFKIITGYYMGNGKEYAVEYDGVNELEKSAGNIEDVFIDLGITPLAVIIFRQSPYGLGYSISQYSYVTLITRDVPTYYRQESTPYYYRPLKIVNNGFLGNSPFNYKSNTSEQDRYLYLAIVPCE